VYGPFFHGGNTGSNPVGDANKMKDLLETPFFRGDTITFSLSSLSPAASRPCNGSELETFD